jgi:hypothetical protein
VNRRDFREKWEARRDEWTARGLSAPAGPLLDEILADLDAVARDEGAELLTLSQGRYGAVTPPMPSGDWFGLVSSGTMAGRALPGSGRTNFRGSRCESLPDQGSLSVLPGRQRGRHG